MVGQVMGGRGGGRTEIGKTIVINPEAKKQCEDLGEKVGSPLVAGVMSVFWDSAILGTQRKARHRSPQDAGIPRQVRGQERQ